jgi:hypothetical protein
MLKGLTNTNIHSVADDLASPDAMGIRMVLLKSFDCGSVVGQCSVRRSSANYRIRQRPATLLSQLSQADRLGFSEPNVPQCSGAAARR